MYKKVISIVKVTLCSMALIGLFTACGSTTNVENVESTVNNEVVESTTVAESEIATTESEDNTETDVVEESKEAITETNVAVESEPASVEGDKYPNYNGSHYEGTLEETIQSYITYEDIEPTTMYVISGNKDESYAIYNDPNVTEGALMMGGLLSANEEVTVDGKATMNGVEYYRLAHNDGAMVNFQYIIPAEYVTTEKQVEQPIENQKPAEPQQSTEQQPTEDQPSTIPEAPAYDPSSGVSEEDWNKVFGIGGGGGNINWQPDHGDDVVIDKDNRTITGSGFIEGGGNLTVH